MKTVLISLSLLMGGFAQAQIITDTFECRAKIVDLKTNGTIESVGMVAGNRIVTPVDSSTGKPYPHDMEVSKSEAKLSFSISGKKNFYKVNYDLHYGFAKRPSPEATEARQYVCNEVSLQSCVEGENGEKGKCLGWSETCMVMSDPFDPEHGWSQTNLMENVPVFNEKLLRSFETIIPADTNDPNGARVTVSCKFKGTYL